MATLSRRRPWRHSILLLAPLIASFISAAAAGPAAMTAALASPPSSVVAASLPQETVLLDSRILAKQYDKSDPAELWRRDDVSSTETATTTAKTKTAKTTTSSTNANPSTETSTTTTESASPLPSIFDSNLGANFTANPACPSFINDFLENETFKACYPFSLLIQGSRSFFEAEKSLVSITQVLDATCAANVTTCTSYLADLAANLTDTANCGADYQLGNPIVTEAYLGMVSYNVLYTATCLKEPDTSLYCYANAITNLTAPSNVYFYYLPLNISLPASTKPSCNTCLKNTMAVFRTAAADRQQPIASTYLAAAQQVDSGAICGPDFVDDSLPAALTSAGHSRRPPGGSVPWLVSALCLSLAHFALF